ncbi:MAG: hypothetical protein V3U75_09695 [Methylococcaceae bacterium]
MNQPHDHSYKLLFSEPEMVVDLLQGFVQEPWVGELDFATLEKFQVVMFPTIYGAAKMMLFGG